MPTLSKKGTVLGKVMAITTYTGHERESVGSKISRLNRDGTQKKGPQPKLRARIPDSWKNLKAMSSC